MLSVVLYQDRNYFINTRIKDGLASVYRYFNNNNNYKFKYVLYNNFQLIKADYAIMWNIYTTSKLNTKYRKEIKNFQKKNKDKLIIIELGFINRSMYYSIGYDSISNFGNYPKFPKNNNRLKKLDFNFDIEFNYNNDKERYILFCLQLIDDAQVCNLDYENWVLNTIIKLKSLTDRKIIIRKHPLNKSRVFNKKWFASNKIDIIYSKNNLEEDLENCYCVIAFNSTVLVDAVLKSVPIIAGHYSSIVYKIAENNIENIENLKKFPKNKIIECFRELSYKQWTKTEIIKGKPFKYFINHQ